MSVIITGAGGLLGWHLVTAARRAGQETIGIGRSGQAPAGLVCDHWISGDLADSALLQHNWSEFKGAAVFHLAANTRIYESGRDFTRDNIVSTETACAIAQRTGGRLIFFSSSAVYSGPRTNRPVALLRENDTTEPTSAYGCSKLAAEAVIKRADVGAVIFRLFGVLSVRLAVVPERGNLVQAILRAQRTGQEVRLAIDPEEQSPVRDYVLASDVCRFILALMACPARVPSVLNLCTGVGTSTAEMVELAGRAAGVNLRVRFERQSSAYNSVMVGDPAGIKQLLGSAPASRVQEFWERMFSGRGPVA